jgi:hypothetical protein
MVFNGRPEGQATAAGAVRLEFNPMKLYFWQAPE